MIKIYAIPGCTRCEMLKNILDNRNMEYEYFCDIVETTKIGADNNISTAPIVEYKDKFYTYADFVKEINKE